MIVPPVTPEIAARISRIENGVTRDAPLRSQDTERVSLLERMGYYKTPGLSVAVINDGQLEWARGFGVLEAGDPTPVTPDTIFQACSISKHVAMVGALSLVQDGALDLDEDINHYLTSWRLPANDAWQPCVTLRQLLAHTAGLTQNWYRGFRQGEPTPTLLQVLEGQPPANTPPIRAVLLPGSLFRYSGSHYSVLQQLMIDVSGAPFPDLMRELVFEPLNMRNSSYDQSYPNTRSGSVAVGHSIGGEPVHGKWRVIPEMAGAGLWTTPSDLALLAIEIQHAHAGRPTRFLTKALADQALAP
jgi:CubicO group peptidase (beta-lactamase class C family)